MSTYAVHVRHDWTYLVDADSPEAAAQVVDDGEAPEGECTGYSIEAVTAADDSRWADDDLRAALACRGGCGKQLPPSSNGECVACLLVRLDSERKAR